MISVKRRIEVKNTPTGKRLVLASSAAAPAEPPQPEARVPNVSRLLALAIQFEEQIRSGAVCDQSALARRLKVTQPRMTQIMNLTLLAPAIQEQVLSMKVFSGGRDPVNERRLRRIAGEPCWQRQMEMWHRIALKAPH
ncbi:hypothetical protein [Gemmatimonas sp.]|jgi:hypothetical protein|uniref:hypothetical protein n=1 Tax=Gemmatimonas sp. TaxID=1962908 RepID=UPI0033409897